jgi:hypothetical protein
VVQNDLRAARLIDQLRASFPNDRHATRCAGGAVGEHWKGQAARSGAEPGTGHCRRAAAPPKKNRRTGRLSIRRTRNTFGEMRESGVRWVLVYSCDYKCSHLIEMDADCWPDHLRLSDIEDRFTCTRCGKRGAEVRSNF